MVESVKELYDLLKKDVGLDRQTADDYFKIGDEAEQWSLTARQYIEVGTYKGMQALIQKMGGSYQPPKAPYKENPAIFYVPKRRKAGVPSNSTLAHEETDIVTKEPQPATNNNYDLKKSSQILPMLKAAFPVVKDDKGVVIDGYHRLGVDGNWPTVTVPIESETQRKIARFVANFVRRKVTEKEKREFITALHLETGLPPKELEKLVPMGYSWIMKYLPDEYKDKEKAEAGAVGGEAKAEAYRKSQDFATQRVAPSLVPCEKCGVYVSEPVPIEGHFFCDKHGKEIQEKPELLKALPKSVPPTKVESKVYKPPETGEFKRARMQVGVSRFEENIGIKLQKRKLPLGEPNNEVTVPFHKPDRVWHFPKGCMIAYFDGPVHKGREDRDRAVREAWRVLGVRVVEIKFEHESDKATDETVDELERNFREMGWNG